MTAMPGSAQHVGAFLAVFLAAAAFGVSGAQARDITLPHNLSLDDALADEAHRHDLALEHLDENQRLIEFEHKHRLEDIARDDRLDGDAKARAKAEEDQHFQSQMEANAQQRPAEDGIHAQNEARVRAEYPGPQTQSVPDGAPADDPVAQENAYLNEERQYEAEIGHNADNQTLVEANHRSRLQDIAGDSTLPPDAKQMERENEDGRFAVERQALDRQRQLIDEAHENRLALIDAQYGAPGTGTDAFNAEGDAPPESTDEAADAGSGAQTLAGGADTTGQPSGENDVSGGQVASGDAAQPGAGQPSGGGSGAAAQTTSGTAQTGSAEQNAQGLQPESPEYAPVQTGQGSFDLGANETTLPGGEEDGSDAEENVADKYAQGFSQGVATCLISVVTAPLQAANTILQNTAKIGAHAGYYWEIGAALARGDTEGAKRILDLKTAEDVQNFDQYAKSLPKIVHLDPNAAGPTAQETGARQGALLCEYVLLPALEAGKSQKTKPQAGDSAEPASELGAPAGAPTGGAGSGELGAGQGGAQPSTSQAKPPHYLDDTKIGTNPSALPPQGPLPNCGALSCGRVAELLGKNLEGGLTRILNSVRPKVRVKVTKGSPAETQIAGGIKPEAVRDGLRSLGIPAEIGNGMGDLTDRLREGRPVIAGVAERLSSTPGAPLPPDTPLHAVVVERLETVNGTAGVVYWDPRGSYRWQPIASFEKFFNAAGGDFVWPL
jgi:hypothetical protein